jgi:CRP/FNR family transcriptional regulator, cyclic AMP receptor protein
MIMRICVTPICEGSVTHFEGLPPPIYTVADGDLLRDLPESTRVVLEQRMTLREYGQGHLFYAPEDEGDQIYFLRRGRVRIYKLSLEGRALTLLILEPQAVFGEMALNTDWRHDTFAESMSDCQVGSIRRDTLRAILEANPALAWRFMAIMSDRLRALERKLADIAFKSVPQRLAAVLLSLAATHATESGLGHVLRYTHQQLAEMIGSYRETITKTIGDFRNAGLIRVDDDGIYLADIGRLRALVG